MSESGLLRFLLLFLSVIGGDGFFSTTAAALACFVLLMGDDPKKFLTDLIFFTGGVLFGFFLRGEVLVGVLVFCGFTSGSESAQNS